MSDFLCAPETDRRGNVVIVRWTFKHRQHQIAFCKCSEAIQPIYTTFKPFLRAPALVIRPNCSIGEKI